LDHSTIFMANNKTQFINILWIRLLLVERFKKHGGLFFECFATIGVVCFECQHFFVPGKAGGIPEASGLRRALAVLRRVAIGSSAKLYATSARLLSHLTSLVGIFIGGSK
jgi:hypothetical protein